VGYIDPQARTDQAAYIHESAWLYGDVELAEGASVWINAALRAELYDIRIGRYTNLQDFVMVHIGNHTGTRIGDYCSITHHVTLHGCTIGDNCLVGINSTIMDGCVIGDNCIIAGHTFLKEGTEIPDNSIVMGAPGRVVKTRDCGEPNRINALAYYKNALAYQRGDFRAWAQPDFFQQLRREVGEAG